MRRIRDERGALAYWMSKRGFTMTFAGGDVYTFVNGEDENDRVAITAESDGYCYTRENDTIRRLDQRALLNHIKETI